jgi:hypothetical protein
MEYTVVYEAKLNELIRKVNELIAQGWIPQGGISTTTTKTILRQRNVIIPLHIQAMTKGK